MSAFSVAFWLKPNAFEGNYDGYVMSNGAMTLFGVSAGYLGYTNTFLAVIQGGASTGYASVVAENNFSTGEWYHYVAVFDGTKSGDANRIKIYLNGAPVKLPWSLIIPKLL